ncbi:MAG: dihydrofolate reductase, partial [Flavobacteriales bacterium]
MKVSLIVAASENNVIGKDNGLIWHLPNDLKFFKEMTMGHHVIMGRKTYESFPGNLPKRENIVVTRNKEWESEGCLKFLSIEEALNYARDNNEDEAFIAGGGEIYRIG